jgi:integrase
VAKSIRDGKLDSRSARDKLPRSGKPYYRSIDSGLHLGYRKGKSGGKWVLRRYLGDEKYTVETIGPADDFDVADGEKFLTFHQAQGKARERVREILEEQRISALGPSITVKTAIDEYVAAREEREKIGRTTVGMKRDARSRLSKYVLSNKFLASRAIEKLEQAHLEDWRAGLKMADGSVRRTVNDFRAALNSAAKRYKARLPPTLRDLIKDGLSAGQASSVAVREKQVLPDADIRAIILAAKNVDSDGGWGGDLYSLVLVMAATGARFSQIVRMKVGDVQVREKRLMVPVSRKGRGAKNSIHIGVRIGEDVLDALKKSTAGRKGHETLLLRPRWRKVGDGAWGIVGREPWHSASELSRHWAAILVKAELPSTIVPYALRHSSIVGGLRAALPVRLVAALHDTSSAMIERHYSAYIVDAMDELSARAVVPLTTTPADVIPLKMVRP